MYRRGDHRVPKHLELPRAYRAVNDYLQAHDPDLRLRRSVERDGWFVLERRCRRQSSVNTAMAERTDIHVQARDGYVHVALTHPEFLNKPWNIVRKLRDEGADLWAEGGAAQFADDLEYEERLVKECRKRRRQEDGRDFYREQFDILGRMGNPEGRNERTRFSNPGLPAGLLQGSSSAPAAGGGLL
jgi:hypothetical protein